MRVGVMGTKAETALTITDDVHDRRLIDGIRTTHNFSDLLVTRIQTADRSSGRIGRWPRSIKRDCDLRGLDWAQPGRVFHTIGNRAWIDGRIEVGVNRYG